MTTARVAGLLLLAGAVPAAPAAAQTSLTIYNDGRVLVRRTMPLQCPRARAPSA